MEVGQLLMEIAELKEAQRWRKYSEEKPRSDGYYIICGSSGFRNADRFTMLGIAGAMMLVGLLTFAITRAMA